MANNGLIRLMATGMICMLLFGVLGPLAGAAAPRVSGRAADTEPANNDPNTAVTMTSDEVVPGSLRTTAADDYTDWYKIDVPYGKVLNVSMYMVDYDFNDRGRINFQLMTWYAQGQNLQPLIQPWTMNRWESGTWLQFYSQNAITIWVEVRVNHTNDNPPVVKSDAGSYTVSAALTDPVEYTGGQLQGTLDLRNGPNSGKYYKLNPGPADNKMMHAQLQCPTWGDFDLYCYNVYPRDTSNPIWMQNASWVNNSGIVEEIKVGGGEGTYYMFVQAFDGAGQYTLSITMTSVSLDDDNIPTKAVLISDNSPHQAFIDQGADGVDWYKVNMKSGKALPDMYFTLNGAHGSNLYNISVFDKDMLYKKGSYSTQSGAWPSFSQQNPNPIITAVDFKNFQVDYDGPAYICVRAINHFYAQGENTFIPARSWYKMTFTLPNDPPTNSKPIPDIHFNEDTRYEQLVLADYFTDPDQNNLNYTVIGTSYHSRPTVDITTGLVTFNPEANWTGSETVTFECRDDGAGTKYNRTQARVFVDPVNDNPYILESITNIVINEEQEGVTPDLSTKFGDVDDGLANLSFVFKVVSSNTNPPSSILPYQYDTTNHLYKIGPCNLFYGTWNVQITCTDGKTGTTPAMSAFQITVNHKNHYPTLKEGVDDPMELTVKEGAKDNHLNLNDLFTDLDIGEAYANDLLTFNFTGVQKLIVSKNDEGYLTIDTGKEEYYPNVAYQEKLKITAKDKAGKTATLNLTVIVEPVNDLPMIMSFQPASLDLTTNEGARESFRITATDVDTTNLTYEWFVDGKKDRNAKGSSFVFEPDFTMGGSIHSVRCEIYDGTNRIQKEWNVTVNEVNRAPTANIKLPANMTKYNKGATITFTAEGSDEDQDALTFTWKDSAGTVLGTGPSISTNKLKAGTQIVKLEVNDTKTSVVRDVTVVVKAPPPSGTPGFGGLVAMAAIGLTLLVAAVRKRR